MTNIFCALKKYCIPIIYILFIIIQLNKVFIIKDILLYTIQSHTTQIDYKLFCARNIFYSLRFSTAFKSYPQLFKL